MRKLEKNLIIDKYNLLGFNVNSYADYCIELYSKPTLGTSRHHIFIQSIFKGDLDSYIIPCTRIEHTHLHLLIVKDIYDELISGNPLAISIANGLTTRLRMFNNQFTNYILEDNISKDDLDWCNSNNIVSNVCSLTNNLIKEIKSKNAKEEWKLYGSKVQEAAWNKLQDLWHGDSIESLEFQKVQSEIRSNNIKITNNRMYDKRCIICNKLNVNVGMQTKTCMYCNSNPNNTGKKVLYTENSYEV